MKLPKKLILLGEIYTIEKGVVDDDSVAEIDYEEKTITFDLEKIEENNQVLEEVFWHELGHYFINYYDLPSSEVLAEAFSKFVINTKNQVKC